jgi:hypothetical protein
MFEQTSNQLDGTMADINDDFDGFDDFGEFDDDNIGGDSADDYEESEPLTPQEEQRLAKFQENVKQAIRVVGNEKVSVNNRVKAALWLGESGEPTAITALRQAYMNATDKKVKKAAADSLGIFRALQQTWNDPDSEVDVGQLLQDIIFEGKMGSVSGAVRTVRRLQGFLVITFVVMMLIGVMASAGLLKNPNALPTVVPTLSPQPTPLPTIPPTDLLDDILAMHDNLVFDAELLAERFQLSIQQRNIACDVTEFRAPDEYTLPEAFNANGFPYVVEFIGKLNTARTELETLRSVYDEACDANTPISVDDANTQWGLLIPLQAQLNQEFVLLLENPDFIPGEAIATPTLRPSPTPFPTATIEPSLINQIILTVEFNINDMNAERGENTLLIQFWTDLELAGTTDACKDGSPILPEDYPLTEEQRTELPIDLINAIEAYNLGMVLTRESWALFEIACTSDNSNIQQGKSKAELAKTSFDGALASLIALTQ